MYRSFYKFFILIFLFGICLPYSSYVYNDLKSDLKKNSITYGYLCSIDESSKSSKNSSDENCFYCIFKNGVNKDCNDAFFYSIIELPTKTSSELISLVNFHYFLKKDFQKTRSPPQIS